MARSFQERLEIFCADFALLAPSLTEESAPSLDLIQGMLPERPDESPAEFAFRCKAIVHTCAYISEHWAAFQNIGYIRRTPSGSWLIEGPLLFALCLHLGADESGFDQPPALETVIDTALQGPF